MNSEELNILSDYYSFAQNWIANNSELQESTSNKEQEIVILSIFARLAQKEMNADSFSSSETLFKAAEDLKVVRRDHNSEKAQNVINLFYKHLKDHIENKKLYEKNLQEIKKILETSCLSDDSGREELDKNLAIFLCEDTKILNKNPKDPKIEIEVLDQELLRTIVESIAKINLPEIEEEEDLRNKIIALFEHALNGDSRNPVHAFIDEIGRLGLSSFMGNNISNSDLKSLINFTISQYHQLRTRRADYLHLQGLLNKQRAVIAAEEQATQLVDSLLESGLKPNNIEFEAWKKGISSEVRQKLEAYFTQMILVFNEDQNREECHRVASEVAFKTAPLIYKQEPYPYQKLSTFFKYHLSKNIEEISKNALAFYGDIIEDDKSLLRKENEPFIDFYQLGGREFLQEYNILTRFLDGRKIVNIFNRALNGPLDKTPSLESLIQDLSSYPNGRSCIDSLVKKYKELREHRSEFLEKQKALNREYQSKLKNTIDEVKKRLNDLISKDRENPVAFQKSRNPINFRDLEQMEGGRYIGSNLLSLIESLEERPPVQKEWENAVELLLLQGANGIPDESTSSPIEYFLETIIHISPSVSLQISEKKINDLIDEALTRYIKIKKDKDLLPELKKRTASAQGISQRWISALSRVQPLDQLDQEVPKTPQHLRINAWALRHFARVAPGKASTVKNTMILHSAHQTNNETSYFRTELNMRNNKMMELMKDNALMLLGQGDRLKKDEVFFFNNPNMRKTLELQNECIDLDKLSDKEVLFHINRICDQIDNISKFQAKQFLFLFNLNSSSTGPTKEIGEKLVKMAERWKTLLKKALESRIPPLELEEMNRYSNRNEKLENYYSSIVLAGIAELDPPFIFSPRLDDKRMFNDSILDATIIQQGFTPPMQNTVQVIAKYSPFAKIKPSGIGIAQKPDYRFYVESISDLCESPIFRKFKEIGKSEIAKEVGVDFIIDATIRLVESLNDKDSTLMARFKRTGEISTLRESFGLVLAAMEEANSFKLGILNRDIADFSRIKEHIMDQVLMWVDDPLPDQSEASKKILMEKRIELEKLIVKAQYRDTVVPDFCQFTAGGMNSLSNIISGLMALKGKKALSVGNFVNCYYETSRAFENIENAEKIVNAGKINSANYVNDIKEMISKIKNKPLRITQCQSKIAEIKIQIAEAERKLTVDSSHHGAIDQMKEMLQKVEKELNEIVKIPDELDAFFVDLHPSPSVIDPVIITNNIKEVMKLILESGIASPIFTLVMDSTISELYSPEINGIILEYRDRINISIFNSCQKFESMGSDRLTGGFFSLFTKNKSFLDVFERFKKNDTVEKFNVDGFIHLYKHLPDKIAVYRKTLFDNTELLYRCLNPKFIFNNNPNQKAFISRKEDKGNYYLLIFISIYLETNKLCEDLHQRALEEGIPIINRQSFGFMVTAADNIGRHIRIKIGLGKPKFIKKQASLVESFFLDICKKLNYDPLI
jgi:hypothetical protein